MTRKDHRADTEESATDQDDGTDDRTGRVDRRDYLRVLGGLGIGGLGATSVGATGTASAQAGFDEAAADQRIRDNQTGPLTVEVVDSNGSPVSDVSVAVEMQGHEFSFGTAVVADTLVNQFGEGDPFREHLEELFNTAVLGNQHKWAIWESNPDLADAAVDWLRNHGLDVRGHTCVYGVDYAVPGDVMTAIENDDGQTVRDRSMQHIEDIITHYGDRIQEWDVVNEAMARGLLQKAVYPDRMNTDDFAAGEIQPWTSPLLADWFAKAESVIDENDLDVDIVTNDFNTLTWSKDRYAEQVQFLADQGIGVDAMGHQSHIGPTDETDQPWTFSSINRLFDRFAPLPGTQRITEYDMAGDSWTDQRRAEVLRAFLKTAYGHPDVDEFMIWGMWDETHWLDEAPFFEVDWTEKPALDVWRNLVLDEWWTEASETTGTDGTATIDAFLGEHEVRVETSDGTTVTETVTVTDSNAGAQVTVTVEGGTTPADPPSVTPVQMNGTYRVENANSGHVLSIENGSTADEASVIQRADEGAPDQQWTFEHLGDGVHRIENANSGSSLDVLSAQVGDGADVIQWPYNGGDNQQFLVGEADGGDLVIVAQHSNRVVEVGSASTADGANVQQWTYLGGNHQQWRLESVEADQPPTLGEQVPTDPDGDGLYEDVSGNGRVDFPDVNLLFQNTDTAAVQDNAAFYDFSDDGAVDMQDVLALFEVV